MEKVVSAVKIERKKVAKVVKGLEEFKTKVQVKELKKLGITEERIDKTTYTTKMNIINEKFANNEISKI
jgi:hypothetical protein